MTTTIPAAAPPLAIIAGGGVLPAEVASEVVASGRRVVLIGIHGEAEPAALEPLGRIADSVRLEWLEWGQIGRLLALLAHEGAREVVLAGSISRRPDFRAIVGDFGTLKRLPRIIAAMVGGDDSVLTRVIGLFEREGVTIVGLGDVAPRLLMGEGPQGRCRPDSSAQEAIGAAAAVVTALGTLDVGQAAVALGRRVVAIEGAEGTDAMLERVAALRAIGRIGRGDYTGVLVKGIKSGQDLRVDLPTIGPQTVIRAHEAGLAGIAAETGRVVVVQRAATLAEADRRGLFLSGFARAAGARA
ncbi:UDP-2,3-diacylglucosamine diphosphatase LpxI [Pseudoxanthobacter sp.]|uniref:LpxI family protein n=1 Tax=Pseudoxanthobacter sp. TaxID=1925742 RepID=UPI002FE3070D